MNTIFTVTLSVILVAFLFLIFYRNKKYAKRLAQQYEAGAQLIDVRSPQEFNKGSIKGAINIPHDEIENRLDELDKSKKYITFCSQGVRSAIGKKTLERHGYDCVNGSSITKLKQKLKDK